MEESARAVSGRSRLRTPSSLARKYSVFTALLLGWVAIMFYAFDLRRDGLTAAKALLLAAMIVVVAVSLARFTNHVLARPLILLQKGVTAVREGRLEPVQVSRTGDEIEYLGESLNEMIAFLAESRRQVREHQELLEERIRQRTEALEEATQRALAASRAKSEFLANISHELRTPMNGLLGMIDIVLDEPLPAAQRDHLETAKNCAHTLLALLNDILDLSKIEAGKMMLEKIPCDLRALADDCVKSLAPRAREKGIDLRVIVSPGVPARVLGDPLRLRQILTNLLSNGVKFTDHGWVEVRVGTEVSPFSGSPDLFIEVIDSGPGIPIEKLTKIFEAFTQADGSISRRYGGTGLGLAITRRLVEMHGGRITVHSEVGRGSSFRVLFPHEALPAAGEGERVAGPDAPETVAAERDQAAARILVVEDNLINQKVVTTVLEKHGCRVLLAGNGRQALETLKCSGADLVLMDIQMPEMDGLTAARLVRQQPQWKHLPIIAMTAYAMDGDRERCLEAGMNAYVSKPVTPAHLLATVRAHLHTAPAAPAAAGTTPATSSPIDRSRAIRLMDNNMDLMLGMVLLFLQLAPERLQKLHSAALRMDVEGLRQQARKMEQAAERIAALEIARSARELASISASEDYRALQDVLARLEEEIQRLDRHARAGAESPQEVTEAI